MCADTETSGKPTVDHPYTELAVEIFALLADSTRVRIVLALRDAELSVNQIAALVERAPSSVSQHLAKMRMARIVDTRHDAQRVFYRLTNEHVVQLVTDALHQAEHSVDPSPAHHRSPRPRIIRTGTDGQDA